MDPAEKERAFARVRAGTLVSWPCSPELPDDPDLVGIRIDAPERALFGKDRPLRLLVTGQLRIPDGYLDAPYPLDWLLFVAVDEKTHEAHAGRIQTVRNRIRPRGTGVVTFEGRKVGHFFNPDLARDLRLPEAAATYLIHASLGDHVSNVLRVRVVDADSPAEVAP